MGKREAKSSLSSFVHGLRNKTVPPATIGRSVSPEFHIRTQRLPASFSSNHSSARPGLANTIANLFAGIDVNPNRFHRSRASLRRPQWGSLRDGLNSRTWPRFDAFMTPIRANILARHVPLPATALPSRPAIPRVVFCARQLSNVYCRIAQREQRLPARHRYRIGKPLIPRHTRSPAGTRWRWS